MLCMYFIVCIHGIFYPLQVLYHIILRSNFQTCLFDCHILMENFAEHLLELEQLLNGIALMKELTPRAKDYLVSFGECMSTRIFSAYLNKLGVKARQVCIFFNYAIFRVPKLLICNKLSITIFLEFIKILCSRALDIHGLFCQSY